MKTCWCGVACSVAGNMPSGRDSENTPASDSGDTGSNNDSGKVLIPDTEGVSNNITDINLYYMWFSFGIKNHLLALA